MAKAAETPKPRKKAAAPAHDHDHADHDHAHDDPPAASSQRSRRHQGARAARRHRTQRRVRVRLGEEIQEVSPRRRRAVDDRAAGGAGRQGASRERLAAVRAAPTRRRREGVQGGARHRPQPARRARRHRHGAAVGGKCRRGEGGAGRGHRGRRADVAKLRTAGAKDAFSKPEAQPYIRAAHALGCLAYDENRFEDAVKDLERVHSIDDGSVGTEARLIAAKALMKLEKPADAVTLLEPATKLEAGAGRAQIALALAHFAAGDEGKAKTALAAALESNASLRQGAARPRPEARRERRRRAARLAGGSAALRADLRRRVDRRREDVPRGRDRREAGEEGELRRRLLKKQKTKRPDPRMGASA